MGVRNDRELRENLRATEWRLTPEDYAEINRIFEEENCPTNIDYPFAVS